MAKSIYQILIDIEGDKDAKSAIEGLGKAAGLTGAALTAFSTGAAKLAADYETAMANVATVSTEATGSTEEFSAALYEAQNQLGGALNVQEAAVASYGILSAGIKDQDAVIQALTSSQKAAIAGQSDLTSVTKAGVAIVNSYGDALGEGLTEAEKFDKAINLMIQTQLDGDLTGDEYAASIGNVAANFKAAGVSMEQVNAIIAVTTAGGIASASSFTSLSQAISNIQKPTSMAIEEAERMGIKFDAVTLQTQGLDGILQQMVASGKMLPDTLAKMFESTEARSSIAVLVDNLDGLEVAYQNQLDGLGALDKAYTLTSDTVNQRVTNSMNLLQGSLIKMGQGVIITFEPFIAMVSQVAGLLSKASPEMLQFAGALTAVVGVTLTLNGAVLIMIAQYGSVVKTVTTLSGIITGTLIPAMTALLVSTKKYVATLSLANIGLTGMMTKAALAAAPIVALGGAFIALNKHADNMSTEMENIEMQGLLQQTDQLAQKAATLGIRISETGEAIPEEEFNKWISLLKQADEGNGTLTGIIGALEKKQASAKGSTTELSSAVEESGDAADEAAKAYDEYAKSVESAVSRLDAQKANSQANVSGGSEAAQARKRLVIEEETTAKQVALLENLKNQSATTAEERLNIEVKIQTKMVASNKVRIDTQKQLEESYNGFLRNKLEESKANLEASLTQSGKSVEESYEQRKGILIDAYELEKSLLDSAFNKTAANSAERQAISTQLAQLEAGHISDLQALETQAHDERMNNLQMLNVAKVSYHQAEMERTENRKLALDNETASLDAQSSILSRIGAALGDQNGSLDQRQSLLELANEITGETLTIDQAAGAIANIQASIEKRKLDLKIQQLKIDKEQLNIANQIKQLEIQGQREQIAGKLEGGGLSQAERNSLARQDQSLATQSGLQNQATDLRNSGIDRAINTAQLEQQLQEILSRAVGQSVEDLERQAVERAKQDGRTGGAAGGFEQARTDGQLSAEEYDKISKSQTQAANEQRKEVAKRQEEATRENTRKQDESRAGQQASSGRQDLSNQNQLSTLSGVATNTEGTHSSLKNVSGFVSQVANSMPVVVDRLTAISSTASVISRQVDFVQRQLNALPEAIAARMPRPRPPSKN